MLRPILWIDGPVLDAWQQMALDELLLERGIPGLRFFRWKQRCITFGYFQAFEEVRAAAEMSGRAGQAVVRRPTGGGIVFHGGDITFSFVFPRKDFLSPLEVYEKLHRGVSSGLKCLGVHAGLFDPSTGAEEPGTGIWEGRQLCFSSPSPMDLVSGDGTKVLGGAMRKRRNAALYQGSLQGRFPGGRAGLRDEAENAVAEGVRREWGLDFSLERMDEGLIRDAQALVNSKYKTEAWNKKR